MIREKKKKCNVTWHGFADVLFLWRIKQKNAFIKNDVKFLFFFFCIFLHIFCYILFFFSLEMCKNSKRMCIYKIYKEWTRIQRLPSTVPTPTAKLFKYISFRNQRILSTHHQEIKPGFCHISFSWNWI